MEPFYIPAMIFFARLLDVSIGTVRIIIVMRGMKLLAAVMGFFEVTIWVLAVSAVISTINESMLSLIAYGLGFATGTLVGMVVEEKLALGSQMVRIVNTDRQKPLTKIIRDMGFMATRVEGMGSRGPVELVFVVVSRRRAHELVAAVSAESPDAYITIEDIRRETHGWELPNSLPSTRPAWRRWTKFR